MISENEIIELIKRAEEGPTLDYKEDLLLAKDGDKAEFVKDVIALANNGEIAHIITGVEDGTGRPVSLKTHHTVEQINQILKDKCDPPISVEYIEKNILGYDIGVIEVKGENPPYIVSVPDKFGGLLSSKPNKSFSIQRGTVYVRTHNFNSGAIRENLDRMYKVKYLTLQSDLRLSHEVQIKEVDNQKEVDITYYLKNVGNALATDIYMCIRFNNINRVKKCKTPWQDKTNINDRPTIIAVSPIPSLKGVITECSGVIVEINKDIDEILSEYIIGASNMAVRSGLYAIPLKGQNA